MADATYNMGKEALDILDNYLDGKSSAQEAHDAIEVIYDRMDDFDPPEITESTEHLSVSSTVLSAEITLSSIAFSDKMGDSYGNKTMDDVLEVRNRLAEGIGASKK